MLDTKAMHDELTSSGFTMQQADGLVSVIRILADTFVTKEYLEKELKQVRLEMAGIEKRLNEEIGSVRKELRGVIWTAAGVVPTGMALLLALFGFVAGLI